MPVVAAVVQANWPMIMPHIGSYFVPYQQGIYPTLTEMEDYAPGYEDNLDAAKACHVKTEPP